MSQDEACAEFSLFRRPLFEVLTEMLKCWQAMSPEARSYYEGRFEIFRALCRVRRDQDPDEGIPLKFRPLRKGWGLLTQSNDAENEGPGHSTAPPPERLYGFKKYRHDSPTPSSNPFEPLLFKDSLAFLQLAALNELRCVHRYFLQLPIRTFSWIHSTIPFLATMTVSVLQAIIQRNLPERWRVDPVVNSIITFYQKECPRKPCIYMASLINARRLQGPTVDQLEYLALLISEYLLNPKDWTPQVQHMHAYLCTAAPSELLKQAALEYHRTPSTFRSLPECMAVRQWCDAVLQQTNYIRGEGRKLPLYPPLCYFGFSRDLTNPRFGLGSKRMDYPMLLVAAFCGRFLSNSDDNSSSFQFEITPVCFPFTTKLAQAAQLFFNAISGSFISKGGGFAYADDDVGQLSPVQTNDGEIWASNFRWVLHNTPFKENMMDEVEFWKGQLIEAQAEIDE